MSSMRHLNESPVSLNCRSFLIPKSFRSSLAIMVSFVFLGILRIVAIRLSHMFFSMCMTSRLCLTFNLCQYGNFNKLTIRLQIFTLPPSKSECFLFPPLCCFPGLTSLTFSNSASSSSIENSPVDHCFHECRQIHFLPRGDVHLEGNESVQNTQFCSLGCIKEGVCHNEYMQNILLWYALKECSKLGNHGCSTDLQHED
jgi:hypothetical protein